MNIEQSETYRVEICVAGELSEAKRICREFCLGVGLCVTLTETQFIYTGGAESGVLVRLVSYPKYPTAKIDLWETAVSLADNLRRGLFQESALVVADDRTEWHSTRQEPICNWQQDKYSVWNAQCLDHQHQPCTPGDINALKFCPVRDRRIKRNHYEGDDIKVLAHGRSMDEAITRAKQIEQVAPSIANTARRI